MTKGPVPKFNVLYSKWTSLKFFGPGSLVLTKVQCCQRNVPPIYAPMFPSSRTPHLQTLVQGFYVLVLVLYVTWTQYSSHSQRLAIPNCIQSLYVLSDLSPGVLGLSISSTLPSRLYRDAVPHWEDSQRICWANHQPWQPVLCWGLTCLQQQGALLGQQMEKGLPDEFGKLIILSLQNATIRVPLLPTNYFCLWLSFSTRGRSRHALITVMAVQMRQRWQQFVNRTLQTQLIMWPGLNDIMRLIMMLLQIYIWSSISIDNDNTDQGITLGIFFKLKRRIQANKFRTAAWIAPSGCTIQWHNINSLDPSRMSPGSYRAASSTLNHQKHLPKYKEFHQLWLSVLNFYQLKLFNIYFCHIILTPRAPHPPCNSDVTFPRAAWDQTRLSVAAKELQRSFKKAG